MRSINIESAR